MISWTLPRVRAASFSPSDYLSTHVSLTCTAMTPCIAMRSHYDSLLYSDSSSDSMYSLVDWDQTVVIYCSSTYISLDIVQ